MKHLVRPFILMMIGGLVYCVIELLWRGYTHISMFFVGGICFVLIGLVNEILEWYMPIVLQMMLGSMIVTLAELISGYVLNILLGLNVWDYSNMPYNYMGQICLLYSFLWFLLSCPAIILDDYLRYWLFGEEKPHYTIL